MFLLNPNKYILPKERYPPYLFNIVSKSSLLLSCNMRNNKISVLSTNKTDYMSCNSKYEF